MEARILRLNKAGQPIEWLSWQDAATLYSRDMVCWTLGEEIITLRGGYSRLTQQRSHLSLHSIIACEGKLVSDKTRRIPPLTNRALFRRDNNICLYCGNDFHDYELTRDHVIPKSRGGRDQWNNVVAACKRCNHRKGSRLLNECEMELLALPFVPNNAEYLALINSKRILCDQMNFLKAQFSANSRLI